MTTLSPYSLPGRIGLTTARRRLNGLVLAEEAPEGVCALVADLAKRLVDAAAEVSVTLNDARGATTAAATGDLAAAVDERQYQSGYGPCLDAARTGGEFHIHDMATETRWPDYTPMAVKAGVLSSLSMPLSVRGLVIGALNIYGAAPKAFGAEHMNLARSFAADAAVVLHNAKALTASAALARQMEKAMASREVIEQAKGILMGLRHIDADEAFAMLRKLSQDSNRKLAEVARLMVEMAGSSG